MSKELDNIVAELESFSFSEDQVLKMLADFKDDHISFGDYDAVKARIYADA